MDILGISVWYIIGTAICWFLGSYLFWVLVARPMFKKWVKTTILTMLSDPDKDTQKAIAEIFGHGWNWFLTAKIKTNNKIKEYQIQEFEDPETHEIKEKKVFTGKYIDEETTPYQALINESTRILFLKIAAKAGGDTKSLGLALANDPSLAPFLEMGGRPQKGETTVDFFIRQLAPRIAPAIEKLIDTKLEQMVNSQGGNKGLG